MLRNRNVANAFYRLELRGMALKSDRVKWLEIIVESVNYIIINYALSNMAMLFQHNPIFILFFASEIWLFGNYWKKIFSISRSKVISTVLLLVCFIIHVSMIYFIGRIVGNIVPFKQ